VRKHAGDGVLHRPVLDTPPRGSGRKEEGLKSILPRQRTELPLRRPLTKTVEMDTVNGPVAVFCKVVDDIVEITECRCGVWPFDDFTKLVEGRVPLVGVFVEIGNLFGRSQGQDRSLG